MPLDRSSTEYQVCVVASTALGTVAGIMTGAMTAAPTAGTSMLVLPLEGAALGFGVGYLLCPYLAPVIKQKIETQGLMTDAEVESAVESMSRYAGIHKEEEALTLLAMVRVSALSANQSQPRHPDPTRQAWELLQSRA